MQQQKVSVDRLHAEIMQEAHRQRTGQPRSAAADARIERLLAADDPASHARALGATPERSERRHAGAGGNPRQEPAPERKPGKELQPWMMQTGGVEGLSNAHRESAERSYAAWLETTTARYSFENYVNYVQRKWAETGQQPQQRESGPQYREGERQHDAGAPERTAHERHREQDEQQAQGQVLAGVEAGVSLVEDDTPGRGATFRIRDKERELGHSR